MLQVQALGEPVSVADPAARRVGCFYACLPGLTPHRPRVLLADDSVCFMELVSELLRHEFQIIGTARDGAAALEFSISLQPDLVVSIFRCR